MRSIVARILGLFGVVLLAGCYPGGADYVEEYDLVYTNYSPTFDFSTVHTYAMPDSVVEITGNLANGDPVEFINQAYANAILDRVRQNLNAYGWTEVDEADDPDMALLPSGVSTTNFSYYYGGGYYGWYYPYGGWYYPGYYPTVVTSYTSGSMLFQFVDMTALSPTGSSPVTWVGVVNGLLEGTTTDLYSRINSTIDQAFKQSSYLDKSAQ